MKGYYETGAGKASGCCKPHTSVFKTTMFGTFNIRVPGCRITNHEPSIATDKKSYWFIEIKRKERSWFGWAIRDHTSKQCDNLLEVLTKEKLPEILKEGSLEIIIHKHWSDSKIKKWADVTYWFETFPFTPHPKADSNYVWDAINKIDWSGQTVYDVGSHYGFFSFKASENGAIVIGYEPNKKTIATAKIIQSNIIHQDVEFINSPNIGLLKQPFDITLYLSVHHQPDPSYEHLETTIQTLKQRTKKHVFVELIMPPLFPVKSSLTEKDIDGIVGGEVLSKYKHRTRGHRKIYWIKK